MTEIDFNPLLAFVVFYHSSIGKFLLSRAFPAHENQLITALFFCQILVSLLSGRSNLFFLLNEFESIALFSFCQVSFLFETRLVWRK